MGVQQEKSVIDLVINGKQSEVTMKSLTAATINQRKALYSLSETDPGYKKQKADLLELMKAQQSRIVKINEEKSAWQKFVASSGSITAGVLGGNVLTTVLQKTLAIIPDAIGKYRAFNAASADMSANLNLSAKDVEYFNSQAEKVGPAMGKSAAEMLEGFKLVGSANSDLIKTPELLADVTDKAVTLSQASKMTLADATASLVGSMNQFDAGADQAGKFINIMAGGAQVGSAEIGDMAMSLKASGIVAHQTGLSFEETNGALQSLSKESLKGEQAGTMLRNILLTLGSGADDTNPRVVGLEKALDNLAKKNLSTAEVTKLFGKENVTAALSLINHRDRVTEFTKGLTGTSAAYDMAAKNNATLDHQLAIFWAKVEGVYVSIATRLVPAFTSLVKGGIELITVLPQLGSWLVKNSGYFYAIMAATVAYYGATIQATIATVANTTAEIARRVAYQAGFAWLVISESATKAYALATGVLTGQISLQTAALTLARGAWAALSAIMLANPIGLVVAGVSALAFAVKTYSDNTKEALALERQKIRLQRDMQLLNELQTKALQKLNDQLQDYMSMSERERAEYVKNVAVARMDLESRLVRMKAREKEMEMLAMEPSLWQKLWAVIKSGGNMAAVPTAILEQGVANVMEIRQQFEGGISSITEELRQYDNILGQINRYENPQTSSSTGGGSYQSAEQKRAAKKKLADAKQDALDLEKMLAESRERIMGGEKGDYDNEVAAFAEKYTRMYELAKTNQEKIDEIRRLSIIEFDQIDKRRQEKEDEKARKQQEADNKVGFDAALQVAGKTRADAQSPIDQKVASHKMGDNEARMLELQADQAYLEQKYLLEETFAQKSAETQQQLTENWNAQVKLRAETEYQSAEAIKQAERSLQDAKREMYSEGIGVLKGFLKEGTVAYKAAIIAQKAFAIAQVIIDTQREIAAIAANPFTNALPGGFAIKAAQILAAKVRAGVSIATIAATGVQELAQKDDGGFTGIQDLYGSPAGYYEKPTRVNQGARSYIVGEKRKEWVMGGAMLQNPVMANLAGALQALQVTGAYRNLSLSSSGSSGGSSATGSAMSDQLLMQIFQQLQANNAKMEAIAQRKQNYNYFKVRDLNNYIDQIEEEVSL